MKKMFFACGVLPGGAILAVAMMLFVGCARLQMQDPAGNVRISGYTLNPEAAMVMSAEAEAVRAQAYATRRCSDDSRNCGAVWGSWGAGMMDTPAGYTLAGIRGAGVNNPTSGNNTTESGDVRKDIADIKKSVRAVSEWQDTFAKTLKNRKKGK